jgi:hypothetical protein
VRLVERNERVASFEISRDGASLVFRSDTGGDDNWSFFRADLDGKQVVELTPGERLDRGEGIEPDGARGRLFFSASKAESPGTEVRELALAGDRPRARSSSRRSRRRSST